jgi:hypothetical protein
MSRISRYQESMATFMKNKSCLNNLDNTMKNNIYKLVQNGEHYIYIILLTSLSSQHKKNKTTGHGYYMGCGIEFMMAMTKLVDDPIKYNKIYTEATRKRLLIKMSSLVNLCLSQNIEYIQSTASKEKTLRIFHHCLRLLNDKIYNILDEDIVDHGEVIKKTDLVKFNFSELKNPDKKIMNIKQANKNTMLKFIEKKYGSVCQAALISGWLFGNGDDKLMSSLEKMGILLGYMIKVAYDFKNLENDLINADTTSHNYVINFGIQDAFELFMDSKSKFIEGCIKHDLYSNTMKEVIDVIEYIIDGKLEKTKPDMKSMYTLESSSVSK